MKKNINFFAFLSLVLIPFFVSMAQNDKIQPIRGVWLTNVASDVYNSRENISKAMDICKEAGINVVYAVVWNKSTTLYPSKTMHEVTGIRINLNYPVRDPLKEICEEAHKRGIKVYAWFEFGFAASYKMDGGPILKNKPDWAAKDKDGKLLEEFGFEWMNPFHPEVQEFMTSLVMEAVENYDIDGVQGCDRFPALPSEGGYDEYTIALYKKQRDGKLPPENHLDEEWIQWRCDILTEYLRNLTKKIKAKKPHVKFSIAPNVYPWSKKEYLQDWPRWVNEGIVDYFSPQLYHADIGTFKENLTDVNIYKNHLRIIFEYVDKKNIDKISPAILLKLGSYTITEKTLENFIKANREFGISGESFFYYEGLPSRKKILRKTYLRN